MNSRHVKTIKNRIIFLEKLIDDNPDRSMGYEKSELCALKSAMEELENEERNVYQNRAFINGQLTILKKYNSTLKAARRQNNESALEYLANWSDEITKTLKSEKYD